MSLEYFKYFLLSLLYLSPFFLVERLARSPRIGRTNKNWWWRLLFLLALQSIVSTPGFSASIFSQYLQWPWAFVVQLEKLWQSMPALITWVCAFLIFTFLHYWTHVARHRVSLFWRWCHQMHHSAERFETYTSLYIHPFELIFLKLSVWWTMYLLGFDFKILSGLVFFYIFVNAWEHMNIRTPRWLGYIIFRPEQHAHHHAGVECNFGVFPLWDLVFGTFQNQANHPTHIGFKKESDQIFLQQLVGRSVVED